jgi:hypothetical protein
MIELLVETAISYRCRASREFNAIYSCGVHMVFWSWLLHYGRDGKGGGLWGDLLVDLQPIGGNFLLGPLKRDGAIANLLV